MESHANLAIKECLDKQYHDTPFYGALRLLELLKAKGYHLNVKKVRRLMKLVRWQTIYRELHTITIEPTSYKHKYSYLLKNLKITHCNQV